MTINTFSNGMSTVDMELFLKDDLGGALTILLVEEDESQAMLIALFLGRFGHKVHIANTGEQAIEMFRQINPDLVLIEVILSGMNGYETTQTIRAEHRECTHYQGYLFSKPVPVEQFHELLKNMCSRG